MAVITITKDNFDGEVINSDRPVLLDFWTDWCGVCKMMAPALEEIANEYGDAIKVGTVNVNEQPELSEMFRINIVPALIVIKNGRMSRKSTGYRTKEYILDLFDWLYLANPGSRYREGKAG